MARRSRTMRRNRNAVIFAVGIALLVLIIIIIIVKSLNNAEKKSSGVTSTSTATATVNSVITVAPGTQNTTAPITVTPTPTAIPTFGPGSTMYTTAAVNFRKAASASAEKLTTEPIPKGTAVTVLGTQKENDFWKVSYNGKEGYIAAQYLSTTQQSTTVTPTPTASSSSTTPTATPDTSTSKTMYVKGTEVNVRAEGSKNGKVVTTVKKDAEVTAYSTKSGWTYIKVGNTYGYISADYLSETKSGATASPSATATTSPSSSPILHANSLSELGIPDELATVLTSSAGEKNIPTFLSFLKAQKYVDSKAYEGGGGYYKLEKLDGGYLYIVYTGNATEGYKSAHFDSTP